jgi:hypothetical protein
MALSLRGITVGGGWNSRLDTLRGYFVRYRLALYLFSAAAVALGVVLHCSFRAFGSQIDNCCSILIGRQPLRNAGEIPAIQQQTTSSRWASILEAN